jgi:dGTPase
LENITTSVYGVSYELDPLATPDLGPHVQRACPDSKEKKEIEANVATRTPFRRDKDRILYTKAFRRLIHKTQVCFTGEMNEHIRTRLTHTLEVSQIARSIARQVHANEDLVEAIALGHDLGHTPFGHTGEEVLNNFLTGEDNGIKEKLIKNYKFDITEKKLHFKHNFQSVRVLNELEEGYKDFNGLNLTYPVLEGILKHTSIKFKSGKFKGEPIIYESINDNVAFLLNQSFSCSLEGQIVALADEIAQVCHDIEDAIEGNYDSKEIICEQLQKLVNEFNINDLGKDVYVKEMITSHQIKYFISCIIGQVISEAVVKIRKNMQELNNSGLKVNYPLNKEIATEKCVIQDNKLFQRLREIENNFVINNYTIDRMNGKSSFVLRQIIKAYITNPKQLPDNVLELYTEVCSIPSLKEIMKHIDSTPKNVRYLKRDVFENNKGHIIQDKAFLRLISDYIASMTDLYALQEYQKLYGGESI